MSLTSDSRSSRARILALVLLFTLSLPAVTGRIYASDEVEGFSWLHTLFFDHDVSFENEYEYFYASGQVKNAGFHSTFLEDRRTSTGLRPNFTTMGSALLWTPFYAAGHLAALATGAPADGLSHPYVAAVAIGSAAYGFLALLLSASMARKITGDGFAAAIAVWLGTPLLFYMYVTPIFAHACSAFAVALFLWTWVRVREHWRPAGALALGLTGGLMTIVRAQDALFAIGPALDFLVAWAGIGWARAGVRTKSDTGPWIWTALTGTLGFVLAVAPQLAAFKALNGRFGQSEYETRKMTWTSPHGWQVLFDHQHGFFFWTPLAAVAAFGLLWLAVRRVPRAPAPPIDVAWIGGLALLMFALQAYIAGSVESWTVAGAFGQRRFVSVTPLLVLGLASLVAAAGSSRAGRLLVTVAIALCVWWNLGVMAQFGTNQMDRQRLSPTASARFVFLELPRDAPALAWRYLTNRSSFYNLPRH